MPWMTSRPPRPGVYTASTERARDMRRQWDGRRWSAPLQGRNADAKTVARIWATPADTEGAPIEWWASDATAR